MMPRRAGIRRRDALVAGLALVCLVTVGGIGIAGATRMRTMDVHGLVDAADRVVLGRVHAVSRVSTIDGGRLVPRTVYDVEVDEALVGEPGAVRLVVREGHQLGLTYLLGGAPTLRRGQRVLLFLREVGGRYEAVAGAQGALVERGGVLVRAGDPGELVGPIEDTMGRRPSLPDVVSIIRRRGRR